jgi:hypothetical protein
LLDEVPVLPTIFNIVPSASAHLYKEEGYTILMSNDVKQAEKSNHM